MMSLNLDIEADRELVILNDVHVDRAGLQRAVIERGRRDAALAQAAGELLRVAPSARGTC